MADRTLTKSRYKLGCECPTKLYYTRKKDYADQKLEDAFLSALADGGYQVGELAKHYIPNGIEIRTLDPAQALQETAKLLERDNVVIYEAALKHGNLFVRVDILVKRGGSIELYEVKSKSFDPLVQDLFWKKRGEGLLADWRPYLEDAAFQKHVTLAALGMPVSVYLMLVDKTAVTVTEGLNQKFMLIRDARGRKGIQVSTTLSKADLAGKPLVKAVNVDGECAYLYKEAGDARGLDFAGRVKLFSDSYAADTKIPPLITKECRSCEFAATPEEMRQGLKHGRLECWRTLLKGWSEAEILGPTVLDIWNFRRKDELAKEHRLRLADVTKEDFKIKPGERGLSSSERQWLQVEKARMGDTEIYLDKAGLAAEMKTWTFPLNFIDFETSMVALPFHKGRHPYEAIAFQFSHHVVQENGEVDHRTEYLDTERGKFPNYDFLRALKSALSENEGTIFRYASHENTFLNHIYDQLSDESAVPDKDELMAFIKSISRSRSDTDKAHSWKGSRAMVDLLELVKSYYYVPETHGSNSIKYVLPATLQRSDYLKQKYAQPIYGAQGGISSKNFKDMAWVRSNQGTVADPYTLLPPVFADVDPRALELVGHEDDTIKEGGAAMTAFARLQFEQLGDVERAAIQKGLLKYCELDTLAMVMIYEAWREWVK